MKSIRQDSAAHMALVQVAERIIARRHYNREATWTTHLGVKVKVRDMEDSHVVNLVRFLEHYETHPASRGMLPVMREEMRLRGLKMPPFQVPYHDGEGNLIIWDFKTGGPRIVGKYKPTLWKRFKAAAKRFWEASKPDPAFWGGDDWS